MSSASTKNSEIELGPWELDDAWGRTDRGPDDIGEATMNRFVDMTYGNAMAEV
jgi:hypothetical protein